MKLETFFEKFDQFADAPDAVAKMRELVLNLAVQGKLVDQIPTDEPANKLIERIRETKERLISEHTIRRQYTDPIGEDEAPFSIPESWVWTRLGEIGDWGSGSTPARGNHDLYDGGIAWLKSGELNDNQALAGSAESVTELALKTGSFRRNQPGDVLFAMYGATIGKVAILAEPAVTNQAVCGCTPFEGISNRYLFNYLVSQRAAFHEASEGGAQPNLSKVKIVAFPFPLPPFAEQKRIVAKVDELMALCDRLEAQHQERQTRHVALARASLARFADAPTPANLPSLFHPSYSIPPADLRKSILTLAVQGKLVPQDPKDEPAEALLKEIKKERLCAGDAESISLLKRNSSIVEPSEFHHDIPDSWVWCELQEISDFINGKAHEQFVTAEPGFALVNSRFVSNSGEIFKYSTKQLTPLFRGDIAMVMSDVPEGRALARCFVVDEDDKYTLNQRIGCIRTSELLYSPYLALVLDRNAYFLQYDDGKKQTNLKKIQIVSCPVPLPPLAEQRRIVAKVDQLMALVDQLETQLAASRAAAANLLEALVAELTTHNHVSNRSNTLQYAAA
jgi:type I restriction enzyme S subunit